MSFGMKYIIIIIISFQLSNNICIFYTSYGNFLKKHFSLPKTHSGSSLIEHPETELISQTKT